MIKFKLFAPRAKKAVEPVKETEDYTNQCNQILAVLQSGHTITPIEAEEEYNCHRLSARIHDLRRMGYSIKTTMGYSRVKIKGRTIVHPYAIYSLEESK